MNLAVRIQHNPQRERWTKTLKNILADDSSREIRVITDTQNDLWNSAKITLQSYDAGDTHMMVLQDDVMPCKDLISTAERLIEIMPDETITLFSVQECILEAMNTNTHWVKKKIWRMAQCYIMPVPVIDDFLGYAERHIKPEIYFDDDRLAMYHLAKNKLVWATAPSLVEHLGWNATTLTGYKDGFKFRPEKRMARWFIGFENSGLSIDWEKTRDKAVFENDGDWGQFCHLYIP